MNIQLTDEERASFEQWIDRIQDEARKHQMSQETADTLERTLREKITGTPEKGGKP